MRSWMASAAALTSPWEVAIFDACVCKGEKAGLSIRKHDHYTPARESRREALPHKNTPLGPYSRTIQGHMMVLGGWGCFLSARYPCRGMCVMRGCPFGFPSWHRIPSLQRYLAYKNATP